MSYAWDFGDGTTGSDVSVTHTFAQDGVYTVSLAVTDNDGLVSVATFSVTVTNVAPIIGALADASVIAGATYAVSGSFSDPGADAWTATVDWGDGSEPGVVALSDRSFSLSHVYATAGPYIVSIGISDDDALTSSLHTVSVAQPAPQLDGALPLIDRARRQPEDQPDGGRRPHGRGHQRPAPRGSR